MEFKRLLLMCALPVLLN